ncbi:hypothetical protein K505DRAFT_273148, partial [Melanomma pulvis-pyrius CBS 109.77]
MTSENYFWISYGIVAKETKGSFDENTTPSLMEIKDFIQWAKEHTNLDTSEPSWTLRVGATYFISEHYQEALLAYKKAEPHLQGNWSLSIKMLETHEALKDFRSALIYVHKLKALHDQLIDTNHQYREAYWERVLLPEGNNYRQLKEYDSAAECFRNILEQVVGAEPWPGMVHANALSSLFGLWNESRAYHSIIDFLRELRDDKKAGQDLTYWLGNTTFNDDFHGHMIIAAKHVGAVEEVCEIYEQTINRISTSDTTGDQNQEEIVDIREQLRYFQAAMRFHGCNSDHD